MFLLNDEMQSKNDEQIEKNIVDRKYEKTVIGNNKWGNLVKIIVGRNITVPSKNITRSCPIQTW